MKFDLKYVKLLTFIILSFIIINQSVWIYNMYMSFQHELLLSINKSLEIAIKKELNNRHEILGGTIAFSPITNKDDTARFIKKIVRSVDTTFQVTLDRYDPHSTDRLIQFLIKDDLPLNVYNLDSLFKSELTSERFSNLNTYIVFFDLKTNQILNSSRNSQITGSYLSSEIVPIDIFNTFGIKAYVKNPIFSILGLMIFQLILSLVLIIVSTIFLFLLVRTIFWQRKEEKMRQDSISAMTHEFKRPISSAVAQAALIPYYLQKDNKEKIEEYAQSIILELNKLTVYTERIQRLSNNIKENISLNKENIELQSFFHSIIEKYLDHGEKQVSLKLSISSAQKYLYADFLHFSNIIENLIENAIKYSNESVHIVIDIEDDKENVKITIKDDGLGISKIDQNYIFDKYYRSKNKYIQKHVGFGLGLTYVKALVEAHNGEIYLKSKLKEGSEFTIYLPQYNYGV